MFVDAKEVSRMLQERGHLFEHGNSSADEADNAEEEADAEEEEEDVPETEEER